MPGTIMDDNRAKSKVLTENLCFEKSGRCRKSAGHTVTNDHFDFSTKRPLNIHRKVPKFITLLVIAASVGLAERVDAACVNLDCSDLKYFRCQNTSMPPHSDILSDNMYIEKSRQYLMSGLGNINCLADQTIVCGTPSIRNCLK